MDVGESGSGCRAYLRAKYAERVGSTEAGGNHRAYLLGRIAAIDTGRDLFLQRWQLPPEVVPQGDLYRLYVVDADDVIHVAVLVDGTWVKPSAGNVAG